jgi:hypothetical protein
MRRRSGRRIDSELLGKVVDVTQQVRLIEQAAHDMT